VVIEKQEYIDTTSKPHIQDDEHKALIGKEHYIEQKLRKYLGTYINAKEHPETQSNQKILKYSTLQYFEKHILPQAEKRRQ